MNLQEICAKYRISDNYLNSKDDAFNIASTSIDDLIGELNRLNGTSTVIEKMERLKLFLQDVRNSTF
jgi:hypothetical protein